MKQTVKNIISIVLCIVMMVTTLQINSFADEYLPEENAAIPYVSDGMKDDF